MAALRTASSASGVPATEVRRPPISEAGGMAAKVAGNSSGRTNTHGPALALLRNQRPESSRYILPVPSSRSQGDSVLDTYSSSPPARAVHSGSPTLTINSVGSVATTMAGWGPGAASVAFGSGIICTRSAGGVAVAVQGPSGSSDVYQKVPLDSQHSLPRCLHATAIGALRARA